MLTYNEVSLLLSIVILLISITMYIIAYVFYKIGFLLGKDAEKKSNTKVHQRRVKHMRY